MKGAIVKLIIGAVLVVGLSAALLFALDGLRVRTVRIATDAQGSLTYRSAEYLGELLARERTRIRLEVLATQGAYENMRMLQDGEADLAIVQNDVPAVAEARSVAYLIQQLFHVIVRDDAAISSVADLAGMRVGTPPPGSGSYNSFFSLLEHYDLSPDDFAAFETLPDADLMEAFRSGELDAIFLTNAAGSERPERVLRGGGAHLLAIDQAEAMRLDRPNISAATLPRGAYNGNPPIPAEDLPTVGIETVLVAHRDLDAATVREITRVLFEHRLEFAEIEPQLATMRSAREGTAVSLPVHPGADRFFNRDEPNFVEANPDFFALILTLITLAFSGVLAVRSLLARRQKQRADQYNQEIVALMRQIPATDDVEELYRIEQRLFAILKNVVDDLDNDRLESESIGAFKLAWDPAMESVRHRQALLLSRAI
jgi:TRAP transporter TAXI family solute receptor